MEPYVKGMVPYEMPPGLVPSFPLTNHQPLIPHWWTHFLLLGVDPFIIMVQGCWSLNTFLAYWWNCEEIIPLFIGFSLDSQLSILMTMSRFKDHLLDK